MSITVILTEDQTEEVLIALGDRLENLETMEDLDYSKIAFTQRIRILLFKELAKG